MCKRLFALALGFAVLGFVVPRAVAADASLDGTTWVIKDATGKTDTLTFKSGVFESSQCTPYGYKASPYQAAEAGKATKWSAICKNDSNDTMQWNGKWDGKSPKMTGSFIRTDGAGAKKDEMKWTATRKKAA